MASSNYSANRYSSILKNESNSKVYDEVNAKKWDLNQIRMNQSLNEFMKSMQKPLDKSLTDANLDITNLDEEETVFSARPQKVSFTKPEDKAVNPDSTTAEFKKYLDDLKKNYLEKLTFSCPSKLTESRAALMNKNNSHMKSVQNISNKPESKSGKHQSSHLGNFNTRRSLYFDNIMENVEEENAVKKSSFATSKYDSLSKNESDPENVENIIESPELTRTQILSRLVQIREYLKQSYTMLSTLQDSNDLINYTTQMNKLHLLIDHLKDQEKGYMDLLKSFSKFQNLSSNLYELETKISDPSNSSSNHFQKDILDLSELNDSVGNQQKEQKQQHTDIIVNHVNYLNDIIKNSTSLSSLHQPSMTDRLTRSQSNSKSIAVQASMPNDFSFKGKETGEAADETSSANSIAGSFISDTVTLNGINCNNLLKFKTMDSKPSGIENLMIIGKGYSNDANTENEDNKTENDLDLDEDQAEFNYDANTEEIFGAFPGKDDVTEQRKEIFNALDNDLATLEQFKEQKNLLKSIRLRKEELKALEGRRVALDALRKIAGESEMEIDRVFVDRPNKMKTSNSFAAFGGVESAATQSSFDKPRMNSFIENVSEESEEDNKLKQVNSLVKFLDMLKEKQLNRKMNNEEPDEQVLTSSVVKNHQQLSRKTFKQPEANKSILDNYEDNDEQNSLSTEENLTRIEPSSQIAKSKKTVKHFEELIRNKKIENEDFANNLLKPVEDAKSNENEVIIDKEINLNESLNEELSTRMKDLAKNEKKLEELYTMQSRLAQLKDLISDYDGIEPLGDDSNVSGPNPTNNVNGMKQCGLLKCDYPNAFTEIDQNETEFNNCYNEIQCNEFMDSEKDMKLLNKEDMSDQKIKLANAKEKLKQLQEIIAKLKNVSTKSELSPKEQNELEQKEAAAALKILNEIEKQKQQQRLEDLKRNKQKLLELLKEKENESAELAKLYTSYSETKSEDTKPMSELTQPELVDDNIENEFKCAENDFEILTNMASPSKTYQHNSPSDILWSQMKKQLNMREDLRNKKQELEDLIRDENRSASIVSSTNKFQRLSSSASSLTDNQNTQGSNVNEENNEDNKIINCYRDFLLKNTASKNNKQVDNDGSGLSSSSEVEDEDEEEIIMKRYIPNINPKVTDINEKSLHRQHDTTYTFKPHQQQNLCPTDELIEENSQKFGKNLDLSEKLETEIFSNYKSNENKFTRDIFNSHIHLNEASNCDSNTELKVFNELSMKFSDLVSNQQKMNESMQNNFNDLVEFQKASISKGNQRQFSSNTMYDASSQSTMANQFQFQMQMQQMMFNINSIHNEINTQKTDMSQLKDHFKSMNDRLSEFFKLKPNCKKPKLTKYTPPNVNITEKSENQSSSIITNNALPSYFYNRRQETNHNGELNIDKFTLDLYKSPIYQKNESEAKTDCYNDYTDDFEECDEDDDDQIEKENTNDSTLLEDHMKPKGYKNGYQAKKYQIDRSSSSSRSTDNSMRKFHSTHTNSNNKFAKYDKQEDFSTCSNSDYDGEIFSFDQMREKIYSEVANLISQNETRPFYLINLFKELQYLKEKNARDQVLKSIFNIANRQTFKVEKKEIRHESQSSMNSETSSSESISKSEHQIDKDEDDDSVTCKYRLKKFNSINRSSKSLKNPRRSTTTDSNFEQDNTRESSSCSQSPFENDSLSNTVIFVGQKLMPMSNGHQVSPNQKRNDEFSRSSSSSILGIQDTNCLKNSHNKKPKGIEEFFTEEEETNESIADQKVIELEVKNLISKIIKMIKISADDVEEGESDSYDSDDEVLDDLESQASSLASKPTDSSDYKHAKCDSDYLNEIIEKVVLVLSQSPEHFDYLKAYKGQLNSYLKEALTKYENKRLIKCMEDILIDISDILHNELTFYSIMKKNNCISNGQESTKRFQMPKLNSINELNTEKPRLNLVKSLTSRVTTNLDEKKKIIDNKLEQLKQEYEILKNQSSKNIEKDQKKLPVLTSESSNVTSRSTSASSVNSETQQPNTEVYYFDENAIKTKLNYGSELPNSQIQSNYTDILGRLKLILNEKTNELNSMMKLSKALKDAKTGASSYDPKSEFTAIDSQDDEVTFHSPKAKDDTEMNEFKLKLLKYSDETVDKNEDTTDETDSDAYTDADSDSEISSKQSNKSSIIKSKETSMPEDTTSAEITIDDLPTQMSLAIKKMDASTAEINISTKILDKIIMESISDDFAGDSDALPCFNTAADTGSKNSEDEHDKEPRSETSNCSSDNFVILSSGSSDQVLIDGPVEKDYSETLYLSADQSLTDAAANESIVDTENQTINEEIFV